MSKWDDVSVNLFEKKICFTKQPSSQHAIVSPEMVLGNKLNIHFTKELYLHSFIYIFWHYCSFELKMFLLILSYIEILQ